MIEHINKIFIAIMVLSMLTFFQRADYNLPLFAFAMILWDHPNQKTRLWSLMAFSLFVDAIWVIFWAATWNSYGNRQIALCNFTIILSLVIMLLKIGTVILLFVKDQECKRALTDLPSNVKSIFTGSKEDFNQIR